MTQFFKLDRINPIVPNTGEEVGEMLRKAAADKVTVMSPTAPAWFVENVCQLFYLAADAFDAGASASIGHNRAERYEARARACRAEADRLIAEAREREGIGLN